MNTGSTSWAADKHLVRRSIRDAFAGLWHARLWRHISSEIQAPFDLPASFIGINIATGEDPACDDYVLSHVRELGISCVRLDLSYEGLDQYPERLLRKAIDEGFSIMLNLLPPHAEARQFENEGPAHERWENFLQQVLKNYHDKIELIEIGNTPNRQKWSGWSAPGYLQAWSIAHKTAAQYHVNLAGPNISDFEPLYNLAYLSALSRMQQSPQVHTDNLFVERVIEPEAYDHRILGRAFTRALKFNLVKKARTLHSIGQSLSVNTTIVSYTTWAMQRLSRWSRYPEQKQADYLVRYLVLAAASGALEKVYWGPLIDHRDGIIDDMAMDYPVVDNVTHYQRVRGQIKDFRSRPAYHALRQLKRLLNNAHCVQAVSAENGVNHFVFIDSDHQEVHLCWCRDRHAIALNTLYPTLPDDVEFIDVCGESLKYRPSSLTEQPIYLKFGASTSPPRPTESALAKLDSLAKANIIIDRSNNWQHLPYQNANWRGAVAFKNTIKPDLAIATMLPEALNSSEVLQVMRDTRNRIWTTQTDTHGVVAVKLNRVNRRKKVGYLFRDSKGRRHWNNASGMLRMGINTPRPLAFFERHHASGTSKSYYVCAFLDGAFSARDVFNSLENDDTYYRGMPHDMLLKSIAEFICNMHNKGVLHRDLSPGNILLQGESEKSLQIYLIDIGRARTGLILTTRQRMIDLMRICFKLSWSDREALIRHYDAYLGRPVAWWWRSAVRYYIAKIESKRSLKRWIRRQPKA